MDFYLPDNIEKLRIKTRNFVDKYIIPLEAIASSFDNHENINETLLNEIRDKVKLRKDSQLNTFYLFLTN